MGQQGPGDTPFHEASYRSQVARLRTLACEVVQAFPIEGATVRLIQHGENAIFRVCAADGRRFVLRIHRAHYHSAEQILKELTWIRTLDRAGFCVPTPIESRDGRLLVLHETAGVGEPRYCDLLCWVDGRYLVRALRTHHLLALGRDIAGLHRTDLAPKPVTRRYWDSEGLVGRTPTFGPLNAIEGVSRRQQDSIDRAQRSQYRHLRRYEDRFPERLGFIHADLHLHNVKWQGERWGFLDFDDCGYGFYMYDLAVAMHRLRRLEGTSAARIQALSAALIDGYHAVRPIDAHDRELVEALVVVRDAVLLEWLQSRRDNPRLRPLFGPILERALARFAAWESS